MILALGKIRRIFMVYCRPGKTKDSLSKRLGECQRCGACCAILLHCPALKGNNGTLHCKFYDARTKVCKTFPISQKDIDDRDLVMPDRKCGFHFKNRSL